MDVKVLDKILRVRQIKQSEDEPTLVFLHEGLGCIELWREFPDLLAKTTGLNALIYDRQGYGKSSPLSQVRKTDYLHIEAWEYLPLLLEKLEIKHPFLIGHSDGGSIALLYAVRHQNTVGIITEAAHVFVEEITRTGIRDALLKYQSTNLPLKLAKYHGDKTDTIFHAWVDTWLSEAFEHWNIEDILPSVKCPVLAIQGRGDEYGTPAQVERIVRKVTGFAKASLLNNCGHTPHLEQQQTVLRIMSTFINEYRKI